jgi:hypothetical protein
MNDRLEGFLSRLPCCRTQALHQDRLVAGWSVIAARDAPTHSEIIPPVIPR